MAKFSGKIKGGVQIKLPSFKTVAQWAEVYGLKIVKGVLTLYKSLNADFKSPHGTSYTPGSEPIASDWDMGKDECGGGLHFSPSPIQALEFHPKGVKFVAVPVRVKDCRIPKNTDDYPQKIKAKGACGPCVEVDIDGTPIK